MRQPGDSVWEKILVHPLGCWEFTGHKGGTVYVRSEKRFGIAHRVAYEDAFGAIPAGHVVRRVCLNETCVNPAHLEAISRRQDRLRSADANIVDFARTGLRLLKAG